MRFWRRNVPNEPTPDADTLPPATEHEAVHPEPEPAPSPSPAASRRPSARAAGSAGGAAARPSRNHTRAGRT